MSDNEFDGAEHDRLERESQAPEGEDSNAGLKNSRAWIPDEALEGLNMEKSVNPSESETELAERLLKEALPAAVSSITHVALYGSNERLRIDASKYLIDRVLGKIGDGKDGLKDPLMDWMTELTSKAEEHANASSGRSKDENPHD